MGQEVSNSPKIPVPTTGSGDAVEVTIARPADQTPYTAGDVLGTDAATNLVFDNVAPVAGQTVIITGAYIRIKVAAVPAGMSSLKLHLFNAAPTALTDNLAFDIIDADRSKYLGYITLPTPEDVGANILWAQVESINMIRKLATGSTSLYGVLQTAGGYTPTSAAVKEIGLCVLGR